MERVVRLAVFVVVALIGTPAWALSEHPPQAAIATAHPLATEAGMEVLAAGGNAFDAAVAVSATLAVVEPYSSGLGGGGFWLLHQADGREVMVDGRERAPLAADRNMYLDKDGEVVPGLSMDGPLAAGIPGQPAALVHIAQRYGQLSLKRSLAPAIRAAREGFAVTEHYREMARFRLEVLRKSPAAARTFLKNGQVPPLGYRIRQPELASTLEAIVAKGTDGFYHGEVATRLVQGIREAGGIWTPRDLLEYRILEREPIKGKYRGYAITSAAPPSAGGVALVTMLNILQGYDLTALAPAVRKHLIIEAMRRAYRDRAEYLGDPDFVKVPVDLLTDPHYAAGLRASIRKDRATSSAALPGFASDSRGTHTTHFSILDESGNYVAATLSINYPFGSGFMPEGTGVLLNDEMDDFSAKPGVPNVYGLVGAEANSIAPGKRMVSSMSPTFVVGNNRVAILGTPGGSRIITMVLLGILDFTEGHGPKSWVSKARFHHQYLPDKVFFEPGAFTPEERQTLSHMGHDLQELDRRYGNMQAILWDRAANHVEAASDPRVEGKALVKQVSLR